MIGYCFVEPQTQSDEMISAIRVFCFSTDIMNGLKSGRRVGKRRFKVFSDWRIRKELKIGTENRRKNAGEAQVLMKN
ncbi:MAG: hypothetical protein LBS52_06580 [Dysgonamonadaceae bacterium]|jgi:hypothetical protein|nr:hypothetical protein [Dysgonamonadaceae bacterium]